MPGTREHQASRRNDPRLLRRERQTHLGLWDHSRRRLFLLGYNGILLTDYGTFTTSSGADANCGGIACIMTSIKYSAPNSPPTAAPEIDPSSTASAMTILLGSIAVMRGRKRWFLTRE